jgi:hypothetical protein
VRRGRLIAELAVLAALTFGGYAVLWLVQNSLWNNGLGPDTPAYLPRPDTDPDAGLRDSVRVIFLGMLLVGLAAWLFARARRFAEAGLSWVVLAVPLVVAVVFYALPPTLSIDAYSYLSHGFLAATPGHNPYVDPSSSVVATPYGGELVRNGWQPVHGVTPYGPLWTAIERGAYVLSGGSVPAGILLINLPAFLAVLGTAFLIWRLLGEIAPERRVLGTVMFLGNPLVLIELVGEGHNDAVMVFFVVLGIYATVRRWGFVAVLAIVAASLVKLSALPLGLLVLVALIVWRRSVARIVLELAAAVVVAAGATVALFAPYWVGAATLEGLLTQGTPSPGWSIAGWLAVFLRPGTAQFVLTVVLVLATIAACFLVRTVDGFLKACGFVALVILLLLPLEWPWYAALPSALLALTAAELDGVLILLLALGSRLVAPLGDANVASAMSWQLFTTVQALVGQTIPAIVGVWASASRSVSERLWLRPPRRPAMVESRELSGV